MAELNFRKTTEDDYDDVVSIRKHLYGGMDYIPGLYHDLLEYNTGFAGFIGNQMVCFMFAAVVDDGKSILIQSIRVREKYEGKGVYSRLRAFCFKNLNPTTNKSVLMISPDYFEKLPQRSAKLVFSRHAMNFETTKMSLQSLLRSRNVSSALEKVDAFYLERLFLAQSATQYLFAENRVVINWVPYEILSSNIDSILRGHEMFATAVAEHDFHFQTCSPMISGVTVYQCEAGTFVNIDLFGELDDARIISDHVNTHLGRCLDKCEEVIVMYVTYQKQQNTDILLQVLSKLNCRKVDEDIMYGIEKLI
ncbi:histidine N-acetyltransferase-like [Pecten maximus]|uniref:histidine N-acetyltransferase-like n=1 Tax=Pecten maximus TaxID=6579 RepID=UPI001458590D|nr:histidine N-acetyltransferase-like [Pecten maximus]